MRNTKVVDLGDKTVKVNEIRVKDFRAVMEKAKDKVSEEELFLYVLSLCVEGNVDDFSISEMETLLEALKEVNASFFRIVSPNKPQ